MPNKGVLDHSGDGRKCIEVRQIDGLAITVTCIRPLVLAFPDHNPLLANIHAQAQLTNDFIRDGEASFGEKFFPLTKEPMVKPDGVTDNFRGQTVTLVAGRWLFQAA